MADAPTSPPPAASADARNRALGVVRLVVVWAAAAALAFFGKPSLEEWIAGLVLAGIGEAVRIYAAGYLVKTKQLITGGPYRFVRNPLYLGRLLILGGLSIAAKIDGYWNLVFLGVGCAVFFFGVCSITGHSPRVLPAGKAGAVHVDPFDPQDRPPFKQIGIAPSWKAQKKPPPSSTPTFVAAAITTEKGPKC